MIKMNGKKDKGLGTVMYEQFYQNKEEKFF